MKRSLLIFFPVIFALTSVEQGLAERPLQIYGYFNTRLEKVFNEPTLENMGMGLVEETAPLEFSFPFLNIMAQQQIEDRFRIFINLNGADGESLDVRNFWGEYTYDNRFRIRLGKTYRRFGIYNEILDATPTYYGIEPPELFDR
jgi:hypothetical protein